MRYVLFFAIALLVLGGDLQLSGHTHGGQMIPWNFLVRLQQPFVEGLHKLSRAQIYVSRGTGYWGLRCASGHPPRSPRSSSSRRRWYN